ncbi:MAG: thioredoxin family protein [Rectinemataceae bacterium]|jgi:thiol-disulfide isomerase/thioredoxin
MKRLTFIVLVLAAFAASARAQAMTGSTTMSGSSMDNATTPDASGMVAAPDQGDMAPSGGKMKADPMMGSQLRMAKSSGVKVIFKNLASAEALAMKSPTVLFFAADWCPNCQADLKDINANGFRLGKVNVVVVDYDKSVELKAKYGITVQDSYVQIDSMGAKLATWNGGGVDGILDNIVKPM